MCSSPSVFLLRNKGISFVSLFLSCYYFIKFIVPIVSLSVTLVD